jgi:hypothetical protein
MFLYNTYMTHSHLKYPRGQRNTLVGNMWLDGLDIMHNACLAVPVESGSDYAMPTAAM